MQDEIQSYFQIAVHFAFIIALGGYFILNMQWYSYRIERVFLHHKKYQWHLVFLLLPVAAYYAVNKYFWIFLFFGYFPIFVIWYRKLDKKLIFTARVKRYFFFLISFTAVEQMICFNSCEYYGIITPLILAYLLSLLAEYLFFYYYKANAKAKLKSMPNLKIVAITASFGKTSIKNFLFQLVSSNFNAYKTPKSVNTEIGLIADINKNLPKDCELYIAEAGAREKHDILKIARLLEHDYAILGSVGEQHIEYFKTLDRIKATKREILVSPKMKKGFVHESAGIKAPLLDVFGENADIKIKNIVSTLEGVSWDIVENEKTIHLSCSLIGGFNAINITAAFLCARELGVDEAELVRKIKLLKPIEHRMQKIEAGGKIIIDDSFNGNLEGMLEAIRIASEYKGRKVIVTPGIVESNEESNATLAKRINEVFDLAIITSDVNDTTLSKYIDVGRRKRVFNKQGMEKMLSIETHSGDLILFANDAPSFI